MKRNIFLLVVIFAVRSLIAADATPKQVVEAAIKKLSDEPNYSWRTTITVPQQGTNAAARSGTTDGKTEKGGYTYLVMVRDDKTFEAALKAGKGAIKTADGWKSLFEAVQSNDDAMNPVRLAAMMLLDYQLPSVQALDLAEKTEGLTLTNGAYAGKLSDAGARQLLSFRRAGMGKGGGPMVRDVDGYVRFWVKDGVLSKCEFRLQGMLSFSGTDHRVDRTTLVEIKDAGTTKISIAEEAVKKASL